MPEIVRLATSVFGSTYNTAVIDYLRTREYSGFGDIHKAAEVLGVHMSKKTLSDHLLYLEDVNVVVGDIPRSDRGPGKAIMYSLNPARLQQLAVVHTNYVLGLGGMGQFATPADELFSSSSSAPERAQASAVDAASTRIINYLSKQVAATRQEIAAGAGVDQDELNSHLNVLVKLGLISEIDDLFEIDRTKIVELLSRLSG